MNCRENDQVCEAAVQWCGVLRKRVLCLEVK